MLKRVLEIVPYVVFLVALFFVETELFGVEDALLGIVFQSFARTMVESAGLSFLNYLKHASLFLLMSVCASFAGLHPALLVFGSALYMFCITLMNSDEFMPRNFFMLGLGFLFLEIYPVSLGDIPMRIVATLFAIACTTVFIYAMRYFRSESEISRDRRFVMRAFDDVGFQLIELSKGLLRSRAATSVPHHAGILRYRIRQYVSPGWSAERSSALYIQASRLRGIDERYDPSRIAQRRAHG